MFTSLHALAKQATLMITIAAEGDGQLRVNVTPMPFDDKAKSQLPKPLSLLATPAEFDADFSAALATWQAPKRSLVQQAEDAAGDDEPVAPAAAAQKAPAKQDKPGRKAPARAGKPAAAEPDAAGVQAAGEAAGEAAAAADQVMAGSEPTGAAEPPLDAGQKDDDTAAGAAQAEAGGEAAANAQPDEPAAAPEGAGEGEADPEPVHAATDQGQVDTVALDLF